MYKSNMSPESSEIKRLNMVKIIDKRFINEQAKCQENTEKERTILTSCNSATHQEYVIQKSLSKSLSNVNL